MWALPLLSAKTTSFTLPGIPILPAMRPDCCTGIAFKQVMAANSMPSSPNSTTTAASSGRTSWAAARTKQPIVSARTETTGRVLLAYLIQMIRLWFTAQPPDTLLVNPLTPAMVMALFYIWTRQGRGCFQPIGEVPVPTFYTMLCLDSGIPFTRLEKQNQPVSATA